MDALALLRRAKEAGLWVRPVGDKLIVRGPKNAEQVVKLLAEHKVEVLQALVAGAAPSDPEHAEPMSPCFERTIPPVDGEPGLEEPCAARRGRVVAIAGGPFVLTCH